MQYKEITPDFKLKFSGFHDLMKFRVREILLVSSLYDAFVLEEDGRLAERIFSEYIDLNLHFIPRITKVSTAEEAFTALKNKSFDLVITMARISDMNPIDFGRKVKELDSTKMVVLLSYDVIDPILLEKIRTVKSIDKVFYWYGESKLLLAIIKYVEDLKNAEDDVSAGVQVILLIEDSPKYYSMFLPIVYAEIMVQTRDLIMDGVNDLHRMLRLRARPKILLAESYEEGMGIYQTYQHNLLGIISDVKFPKNGKLDDTVGFRLARKIKSEVPDLPILLQSAEPDNKDEAEKCEARYLNKNSQNLLLELRNFILSEFGFGDFVFRYPDGKEIARAKNLSKFAQTIQHVPIQSIEYHARRNHISIWLRARTEFELADELRPKQISDFPHMERLREYIVQSIQGLLQKLQRGVIKDFGSSQYFTDNSFVRLGSGSLGGKGRGLAFVNALLADNTQFENFKNIDIKTPQTFVIGTEVFEEFLEINNLQEFAINTKNESKIVKRFLNAQLPEEITPQLKSLLKTINYPVAVRSSSLLEDSQLLPFAGLYKTYMLPNNHPNIHIRLRQLINAIRLVYASVYFSSPKEYMKNTDYRIEEEKMAIIIQQISGIDYNDKFYPVISGVAQSYNYYPISHMKPEDGMVHLALGLGKTIMEGGQIYRFSPSYPKINLPYNSPQDFVDKSQSHFYAVDLSHPDLKVEIDEHFSLLKLDLTQAEKDGSLFFVGSTFSPENAVIKDSLSINGPRIITFANILKYQIFPLSDILMQLLELGKQSLGTHVEIEFSINLYREPDKKPEFNVLQIRPIIATQENGEFFNNEFKADGLLCESQHAIGNGIYRDMYDLIYLDPETFEFSKTCEIAKELEDFNIKMDNENRHYILIGFGRWGTADPWLGIPVEWYQISRAKVLIESNFKNFTIDPSAGSHFFHNLVSLRLGYFYIKKESEKEYISWDWIKDQNPYRQTKYLKHIRFKEPLVVKINGRSSTGIVSKPNGTL